MPRTVKKPAPDAPPEAWIRYAHYRTVVNAGTRRRVRKKLLERDPDFFKKRRERDRKRRLITIEKRRKKDKIRYALNREKIRAYQRQYRIENKERLAENKRELRRSNGNYVREQMRQYTKRSIKELRPWYVLRICLGLRKKDIPEEQRPALEQLVDLKREQIKLRRLIRQKQKEETT